MKWGERATEQWRPHLKLKGDFDLVILARNYESRSEGSQWGFYFVVPHAPAARSTIIPKE